MLAIYKKYPEAVEVFQPGVAAGDSTSAGFLMHGFSGPEPTDRLFYLALEKDPERARRYEQIGLCWRNTHGPILSSRNQRYRAAAPGAAAGMGR